MTIKKLISVKKIKTFFGDGYGFFTIPIFMVFFAILMSWVTEISDYKEERKSAVSSITNAQINVIKLVNHSLSQVLEHGVTVSHIAQQFLAKPTPDLRNVLINLLKEGQGFTAIALYDTHGKLVNTLSHKAKTFIFPGKLNSAENESFSNKQLGVSFFSWVSRDRSVLVFPLFDTNRQPLGMMLANLDLNYALNQYKDIAIGDTGNIQIFSNDGIEVTALHPDKSNSFKASANLFKVIPAATATGTLEKQTARGENIRLISYIKNSASPFVVTISQDKDEILKSAKSRHNRYMIAVLITALFTALSLLWMLRVTKRRHQLYRKLLVSEKAKSSLLNALEDEKEKAYALATHDHVTHLPNRQLFMELAVSHLARAKRSRHHYAAMFIDLDRFKPINDSLGHHIGDMVLQEIALRLKNCLRESDIVSRFGSDEFVVMLAGVGAVEHIRKIAEKIIHSIEQPFNNLEGNDVQLSSTIGISVYPRDGINVSLLIKAAEDAMHRSKRAGQGRYVFFDQTNQTNSRLSFELDQGFYKAIQNNEFLLHYQPKVRSTDFAITGVEALIRWQHPQHGLIFPGDFIPILESSDKIVDLGDWVINEACRQLSEWKTANKRVVPIAINVSTKQLLDKEFVTRLTRTLQKYALDAEDIEIEVTESCFMNDTAVSVATLNAISAMGIHVSLDDFGTGFSSLGYIKALPVSEIKIDRSFIRDIRSDQSDKVIVSSTIELAHNLGLTVVAEGVETLDQITYLRAAGCDVVQGYYFSRPVSAELIREILDSGSIEQSQWLLNKFSGHQASLAL